MESLENMNGTETVIIPDGNQNKTIRALQDGLCKDLSTALNVEGIFVAPMFPLYVRFDREEVTLANCKEITSATLTGFKTEGAKIFLLAQVQGKELNATGKIEIARLVAAGDRQAVEEAPKKAVAELLAKAGGQLPIKLCVFKAAEVSFTQEKDTQTWALQKEKWVKPAKK